MSDDFKGIFDELFSEIIDFNGRNGWTKDPVFIGTGPDPHAWDFKFIARTRIEHTWWTQSPQRYPEGSVIFANGWRLCLATSKIFNERVYVFPDNEGTDLLWRKQIAKETILAWARSVPAEDLVAGGELLAEAADMDVSLSASFPHRARRVILAALSVLGLKNLEDAASLVKWDLADDSRRDDAA